MSVSQAFSFDHPFSIWDEGQRSHDVWRSCLRDREAELEARERRLQELEATERRFQALEAAGHAAATQAAPEGSRMDEEAAEKTRDAIRSRNFGPVRVQRQGHRSQVTGDGGSPPVARVHDGLAI